MGNELLLKTTIRDILAAFSHAVENKTGRPFRTFKWPHRLVYFHLTNQRAEIYYQTRKQNQLESNYEDYNEVLPCVAMKEVNYVECPCAPQSHCTYMKIVKPLPKFLTGRPAAVTTLDGFNKYDFVEWSMFKNRINHRIQASNKANLFTKKIIDNEEWIYTYITKDMKARNIQVSGPPIDPMEMALYPVCGKPAPSMCDLLDYRFIIEKRLTNVLFDATYNKLLKVNAGLRIGDTKNDDRNAETSADPRY